MVRTCMYQTSGSIFLDGYVSTRLSFVIFLFCTVFLSLVFSSLANSIRRQAKFRRRKRYTHEILWMVNTFDWRELPVEWRQAIGLALNVIPFVSRETEFHIFEDVPALRYDREVWVAIIKPKEKRNAKEGSVERVIRRYAPSWIVSDRELNVLCHNTS